MLTHIAKVLLIVALGFLAGQVSQAMSPPGRPWCPQFQAIQDAASLRDPVAREAALRQAIRHGLFESDPAMANEVFGYLSKNIRWLDLRPFEDIVMEYSRIDPTHRGIGLLDEAELFRTPRDERLRIYSAAIIEGTTRLKHGSPLPRQSAMQLASDDGLAELKPLIETHYPEETAQDRRLFPLPELLVRLDLGAGASDREDANRLASERIVAMKDADFRDRMNTDVAFQKVVGDIATYVCAVDAFAPRRNPGCASIKDIVKRQEQLDKAVRQASGAAVDTSTMTMQEYEKRRASWLGRMQELSAGEPSVQQTR